MGWAEDFVDLVMPDKASDKSLSDLITGDSPAPPQSSAWADRFMQGYDEELNAEFPQSNASAKRDFAAPEWSSEDQFANAFLLGGGVPVDAFIQSLRGKGDYGERKEALLRAKEAWEKENPGTALGMDITGSLVPAALALRAGGAGASAVGSRLAGMAPNAARVIESLGGKVPGFISRAAKGAVEGAGAGALTSGLTPQDFSEDVLYGATAGAALNGLLGPLASSYVAPYVKPLVKKLSGYGVEVKGGQIPGAPGVAKMYGKTTDEQIDSLNTAIAKTVGLEDSAISKPILRDRAKELGKGFDKLESRYGISLADPELPRDIARLRAQAQAELSGNPQEFSKIMKSLQNLEDTWASGNLTGEVYHNMVKFGSELDRLAKSRDSALAPYASQLKKSLHSAWERSLPKDAAEEWKNLRTQYRNLQTIFPAAKEEGSSVNLDNLYSSVRSRARTTRMPDGGDLGILMEGYKQFLQPHMKPSGMHIPIVDKRVAYGDLPAGGVAGMIALGENPLALVQGAFASAPVLSALGTAAAVGAPIAGRALNTRPGRSMILNNSLRDLTNPLLAPLTILKPGGGEERENPFQ